jgi:hypothetical protein
VSKKKKPFLKKFSNNVVECKYTKKVIFVRNEGQKKNIGLDGRRERRPHGRLVAEAVS